MTAVYFKSQSVLDVFVDNISGEFVDGEGLLGPTWAGPHFIGDSRVGDGTGTLGDLQPIGQVTGVPAYRLTTIREVRTGINWTNNPNVVSGVTLASGSAVTVDTTGLSGIFDLIDVDILTDVGANLPSGVSVSGNKLVLTI